MGQTCVMFKRNELLNHLFSYDILHYYVAAGEQCRIEIFRADVQLYRTTLHKTPVRTMLLTTPPVTVLDLQVPRIPQEFTGFNDEGERCGTGSRLASHHKECGFTMGDVLEIAAAEFDKRRGLSDILFKSMDHIKEKRMGMIYAGAKRYNLSSC